MDGRVGTDSGSVKAEAPEFRAKNRINAAASLSLKGDLQMVVKRLVARSDGKA